MSGIKDYKITDTTGYKVSDTPGETLSGTVAQNKQVFDNLGELIITKFNAALEYMYDQGIDTGIASVLTNVYPVGSIYMSVSNVSPTTLFGGTWVQLKDTFLLAAGDTYTGGSTGGSADAIVPSHNHYITAQTNSIHNHGLSYQNIRINSASSGTQTDIRNAFTGTNSVNTTSDSCILPAHYTESTGVSATGKNMPPYLTVYMWKRTA